MLISPNQLRIILNSQNVNSTDNLKITNQLIKDLEIQNGFGLASFLELDSNFNNYTALRVWVNKRCEYLYNYELSDKLLKLKNELREALPYDY